MSYGTVNRAFARRTPDTPEELLSAFRNETLPALRQIRDVVAALSKAISDGTLIIGGFTLMQGTGAPTATPTTTAAMYFRRDPSAGAAIYAWNGATWNAL